MAAAKKAKKDVKAFDEYSIAELKEIVKQHVKLEAQLAAKDDQMAALADKQEEDHNSSVARHAERITETLHKQILLQMLPERELSEAESEKLRGPGRALTVLIPNVSEDMIAQLGLDKVDDQGEIKPKWADSFFSSGRPTKSLPGKGDFMLQAWRPLTFKYKKSRESLQVDYGYKMIPKPKPKPKPKPERKVAAEEEEAEGEQQADGDEKGTDADADAAGAAEAVAEAPSPARGSDAATPAPEALPVPAAAPAPEASPAPAPKRRKRAAREEKATAPPAATTVSDAIVKEPPAATAPVEEPPAEKADAPDESEVDDIS